MSSEDLCRELYNTKFRYHNERELQIGVGKVLDRLGLSYQPEFSLTKADRIDFLIGTVGIECKTYDSHGGTSLAAVTRQLHRYVQSPLVEELILLTTMSKHKNLPESMNGKSIYVVHLLHSFL